MTVTSASFARTPGAVGKVTRFVDPDTGKPLGEDHSQTALSATTKLGAAFASPAPAVVEAPAEVAESDPELTCGECGYAAKTKAGLGAHKRSHQVPA